jgi:protein lin-37
MEKEKSHPEDSTESEKEESDELPMKKSKIKPEKESSPVIKETKQTKTKSVALPSYIMKLFDRSVNLARFDEETALYPLCRSWMTNAPRHAKNEVEEEPKTALTVEEGDVGEMPRVRVRKGGRPLPLRKDTEINKVELDKAIDPQTWTKEKILDFHKTRWGAERQKAIDSCRNFEEKHFAANIELLESLFKGNEE